MFESNINKEDDFIILTQEATPVECLIWDLKQKGLLMQINEDMNTKKQYPFVLINADERCLLSSFWSAEKFI